jgi:hypothetical protein
LGRSQRRAFGGGRGDGRLSSPVLAGVKFIEARRRCSRRNVNAGRRANGRGRRDGERGENQGEQHRPQYAPGGLFGQGYPQEL